MNNADNLLDDIVRNKASSDLRTEMEAFVQLLGEHPSEAEAMIRLAWADDMLLFGVFGLLYPELGGWKSHAMVGSITEKLGFINHFVGYYLLDDGYPGLARISNEAIVPWETGKGHPFIHQCKETLEQTLGVGRLPVLTGSMVVEALDAALVERKARHDRFEEWEGPIEVKVEPAVCAIRNWLRARGLAPNLPVELTSCEVEKSP